MYITRHVQCRSHVQGVSIRYDYQFVQMRMFKRKWHQISVRVRLLLCCPVVRCGARQLDGCNTVLAIVMMHRRWNKVIQPSTSLAVNRTLPSYCNCAGPSEQSEERHRKMQRLCLHALGQANCVQDRRNVPSAQLTQRGRLSKGQWHPCLKKRRDYPTILRGTRKLVVQSEAGGGGWFP